MKCYLYRATRFVGVATSKPTFTFDGDITFATEPKFILKLPIGSPFIPDKYQNMQTGDIVECNATIQLSK